MSKKYSESGVSLERGYESIRQIKGHIDSTKNKGTMGGIGDFGGMFDLSKYNIKEPVLVSGTDGVGTKLLIAQEADIHNTIGIDLVAMCVNDIVTLGAIPLYFLDYIATRKNEPEIIASIVGGIAEGCRQSGCALIGGETAEMPDVYQGNHYDLAGYTTGVIDKQNIISKDAVHVGDVIIGLPSSGIHSNGYSLVRKIFFKDHNYRLDQHVEELGTTLQEELLKPTTIYVKPVLEVLASHKVHSIAHITGGGFIENIPRAIPEGLGVTIQEDTLPQLPIFSLMERLGGIDHEEMFEIFNMGIGMILIVDSSEAHGIISSLKESDVDARIIGTVTNQEGVVIK